MVGLCRGRKEECGRRVVKAYGVRGAALLSFVHRGQEAAAGDQTSTTHQEGSVTSASSRAASRSPSGAASTAGGLKREQTSLGAHCVEVRPSSATRAPPPNTFKLPPTWPLDCTTSNARQGGGGGARAPAIGAQKAGVPICAGLPSPRHADGGFPESPHARRPHRAMTSSADSRWRGFGRNGRRVAARAAWVRVFCVTSQAAGLAQTSRALPLRPLLPIHSPAIAREGQGGC